MSTDNDNIIPIRAGETERDSWRGFATNAFAEGRARRAFGDVDVVGRCYLCTGSLECDDEVVPVGGEWTHLGCAEAQGADVAILNAAHAAL